MQEATYSRSELERWGEQVNLVLSQLGGGGGGWGAGWVGRGVGGGGVKGWSRVTGLEGKTVRRGRDELDNGWQDCPADRVRREGAGHPPVEKKVPASSKN